MENKTLELIVKSLDSKRAEDIEVIGISDLTVIADYFVIANGTSTVHTKTLLSFSILEYEKSVVLLLLMLQYYRSDISKCFLFPFIGQHTEQNFKLLCRLWMNQIPVLTLFIIFQW